MYQFRVVDRRILYSHKGDKENSQLENWEFLHLIWARIGNSLGMPSPVLGMNWEFSHSNLGENGKELGMLTDNIDNIDIWE